jgi:hypothetical protein
MIFLIKIFRLDHIGIVRLYLRSTAGVLLLPVTFIGDDAWDKILLVEYPSKASFVTMLADPEYQQAVHFRTKALSDSRLYITTSLF